jgi:hypothetical protein
LARPTWPQDIDQEHMMAVLLLPFMALAAAGLLLSIGVHVASLFGLHVPGGALVLSLHIGIIVVWIPAVLVAKRANRGRPQRDYWRTVLSGCPAWMHYAGYALAAYALANFLWFIATNQSQDHLKNVNAASVIRAFSGHWLVFYGAAFAIFYSAYRNPRLLLRQRCPDGHDISASDVFCPTCGKKLSPMRAD